MKTFICMIEGNFGRASRETKKFKALNQAQAWAQAQKWCSNKGLEFDIIELSEAAE
jgi:hypothetical protein